MDNITYTWYTPPAYASIAVMLSLDDGECPNNGGHMVNLQKKGESECRLWVERELWSAPIFFEDTGNVAGGFLGTLEITAT